MSAAVQAEQKQRWGIEESVDSGALPCKAILCAVLVAALGVATT